MQAACCYRSSCTVLPNLTATVQLAWVEWESGSAGSVCARRVFPLKDFPRTTTLMETTDLNGMEATPESPNRRRLRFIMLLPLGAGSRAHEKPPIILYTRGSFSPAWCADVKTTQPSPIIVPPRPSLSRRRKNAQRWCCALPLLVVSAGATLACEIGVHRGSWSSRAIQTSKSYTLLRMAPPASSSPTTKLTTGRIGRDVFAAPSRGWSIVALVELSIAPTDRHLPLV